jgi:hypothetical protein
MHGEEQLRLSAQVATRQKRAALAAMCKGIDQLGERSLTRTDATSKRGARGSVQAAKKRKPTGTARSRA